MPELFLFLLSFCRLQLVFSELTPPWWFCGSSKIFFIIFWLNFNPLSAFNFDWRWLERERARVVLEECLLWLKVPPERALVSSFIRRLPSTAMWESIKLHLIWAMTLQRKWKISSLVLFFFLSPCDFLLLFSSSIYSCSNADTEILWCWWYWLLRMRMIRSVFEPYCALGQKKYRAYLHDIWNG